MSRATMFFLLIGIVAAIGLSAERKEGSSEQIRLCVRNLSHELPRMRAAAARALAEIGGESTVEPLVECLTDSDADVRLSAASALGRINQRPLFCIEQLTKLLHDKDEHVRYSAQWAIGQFAEGFLESSSPESANTQPIGQLFASAAILLAETRAPETIQKRVREASESLLHRNSPRATSTEATNGLDALVADLKADDIYIQVRALSRLKDIEPKNVAQLIRLLAEIREESAVEWQIPAALAEAGREIVPGLIEILQGDDEEARALALDVLIETRYGTEQALPQLNKILANNDAGEDELEKAVIIISDIRPAAKDSIALLTKLAANGELSETVRTEAIEALAAIGPDAESALPAIKRLLRRNEEPKDVRIEAAGAVVTISRQPDETLKLLTRLIEETDDSDLATGIAANLRGLGAHAAPAVPLMILLLEAPDVDGDRRQDLILALGKIGPAAKQAIPALIGLLVDPEESESIQVAAALTIGKVGPEAVRALAEQFRQPDAGARATIARAMVAIGPKAEPAVGELIRVLANEEEEDDTRVLAAIALGKIGESANAALPALTKLLQDETNDDQFRSMCAIAIGCIYPEADKVLQRVLIDPPKNVQIAAAYAIAKMRQASSPAALEQLVQLLADDEAADFAARALTDLGSDAVVPLCSVIFNPSSDLDFRIRCVDVLGDIGTPAVTTLIGLLDKPDLAEAAREALARQDQDIVPMLLLAAESQTEFNETIRETLRELVRGYYDGLGAGPDELTWGQAHPLAGAAGGSSSGSKKIIRLGPPLAVMGKPRTEVTAKGFQAVKVFYGTNRRPGSAAASPLLHVRPLRVAAITALALCFLCLWFHTPKHMLAISMTGISLVIIALPLFTSQARPDSQSDNSGITYGGEYTNQVEMGVCDVSIPDIHEEGELEGPSLIRLQIKVDPERHIVLGRVQPLTNQAFFTGLEDELNQKGRNVLVFVHGYNVSFADAARRTAQMAADLKFPGAAVFYSWPSQAHFYKYRLDEKNVELSVEQLKSFLLAVAERSQATTINLVAHSMGNRLLTEALKEIDASSRNQGTLFNQVVLAAPDIDAAVFKNRIAPAIVTKAQRITLYASSKDLALYASRQFNSGDPRAGDAGNDVLVIPGIETIDASAGDCSLLGHCYYGDSVSILHDIQQLLANHPARDRQFLHPISRSGSMYWVFEPDNIASQPRAESMVR
ncbi:MAG TPA: alpha/beta hydrolase [Pirellulaceae bacterium]|jgi:esterase/lipase superfamily enzyme/HEAT repeat protein